MKTICPHCKEEFPETPDEYLGMTLECPICQKQFVCEKPKFCSECGAVNTAKALTCAQCGHSFPINPPPPVQPPVPPPVQNCGPGNSWSAYGGDENDCFMEEVGLFTAWGKFAVFQGRSRRKECFLFGISVLILDIIVALIAPTWGGILSTLSLLASIPLDVRRLHDMGLSGAWLIFLLFFPFAGLVLLIFPSQPGGNQWGPNPVGVPADGRPYRGGTAVISLVVTGLVLSVLPLLVLALALLPALSGSREAAQRIKCTSHLKQAGLLVQMYACDYDGDLPTEWQTLRIEDEGYTSEDVMQCPASPNGYVYLGNGLNLYHIDDFEIPIAMDAPGNHGKDINLLYADGHAETRHLSRKMTSCEGVLRELHPELSQSPEGRIVLENARKADAR